MRLLKGCFTLLVVLACSSEAGPSTTGTIRVTVNTVGQRPDPDGYNAIVDESVTRTLTVNGDTVFGDLDAGPHSVQLTGISTNCTPDWYAPQIVEVKPGETVDVAFTIRCAVPLSRRIIFSSTRDNVYRNIYSMATDGTDVRLLATDADQPKVSPGGTRIVFQRHAGGTAELWVMNADGGGQVNLTNSPNFETNPAWSPDGTKLVFIRWGQEREVVVASADGRRDSVLYSSTLQLWAPAWSPDGGSIAFDQADEIRLLNLESGAVRVVVKDMHSPAWTPAGDRITAARVLPGRPADSSKELISILPDGSDPLVVVTRDEGSFYPAWSPDGTQLIFLGWVPGGFLHIFTVSAAGTGLTDLTTGSGFNDFFPGWSP